MTFFRQQKLKVSGAKSQTIIAVGSSRFAGIHSKNYSKDCFKKIITWATDRIF